MQELQFFAPSHRISGLSVGILCHLKEPDLNSCYIAILRKILIEKKNEHNCSCVVELIYQIHAQGPCFR